MFAHVARSRLLPMSLPFRYCGAAVAFQVAAWALDLGAALAYAAFFVYVVVKARRHDTRPRHQPATA